MFTMALLLCCPKLLGAAWLWCSMMAQADVGFPVGLAQKETL